MPESATVSHRAERVSLTDSEVRWRPGWKMTLCVVLLLPLGVGLGFWQLERAEEKHNYEEAYLDRISAFPVAPPEALEDLQDFQRLRLTGRFEPGRDFLLDNQTRHGAVGYLVVSSFLAGDGRRWLVNRGFIEGGMRRQRLPEVVTPEGEVFLIGVLWPEVGLLPMFSDDEWVSEWPKRIQRLEVERMAGLLGNGVAREVRLEAGQIGAYTAPVLEMNMPSEKHTGYAVQWFGLTIALMVGYLIFGFRRHG
jgi:cytochrome oxidase assembly protein ShyY1